MHVLLRSSLTLRVRCVRMERSLVIDSVVLSWVCQTITEVMQLIPSLPLENDVQCQGKDWQLSLVREDELTGDKRQESKKHHPSHFGGVLFSWKNPSWIAACTRKSTIRSPDTIEEEQNLSNMPQILMGHINFCCSVCIAEVMCHPASDFGRPGE